MDFIEIEISLIRFFPFGIIANKILFRIFEVNVRAF